MYKTTDFERRFCEILTFFYACSFLMFDEVHDVNKNISNYMESYDDGSAVVCVHVCVCVQWRILCILERCILCIFIQCISAGASAVDIYWMDRPTQAHVICMLTVQCTQCVLHSRASKCTARNVMACDSPERNASSGYCWDRVALGHRTTKMTKMTKKLRISNISSRSSEIVSYEIHEYSQAIQSLVKWYCTYSM